MSLPKEIESQDADRQSGKGESVRVNPQIYQDPGNGLDNRFKSGDPVFVQQFEFSHDHRIPDIFS